MSAQSYERVWDAIEATPAEAANLRVRSALMAELVASIERGGLSQREVARRFGVTQSRISDLTRGKIDLFSIDTLVNMLTAAGLRLDVRIVPAAS